MVKIVLSTGVLDVAETLSLPITFNIGDIRDLSARKGTFSKTVTLEGTKNNNELLGHYYDVNIQAGTFNINALTKCQVIQNGVPILDEALLQLVSVNKVQSNNSYEDEVTYSVLIKDSRAEFFTAITNANLTDLDFSDLDHAFDSGAIVASFNNTVADGYKYLMPYNETNEYNANDFKPAIYAKTYWDRIFAVAGFTYTWDEIGSAHFDKLVIPYNGDTNDQNYEDYKVEATNTWTTTNVQAVGYNTTFSEAVDSGWSEVIDTQSLFDPALGEYSTPISTSAIAGEHYIYTLTVGGTISLDNTSGANAVLTYGTSATSITQRYRVFAQVFVSGFGSVKIYGDVVTISYPVANPLPNGSTIIQTFSTTLNIPTQSNGTVPSIDAGDIQILSIGVDILGLHIGVPGTNVWKDITLTTPAAVNVILDLTSINMVILPSNNVQVTGGTLLINQYVPVEIKQSDFVKGILQMYNLYVEQDIDNPYNLVLRHRDEYYDSGAEKDWSSKLAKDRGQDLVFLPDLTKKKLKLTYAPDDDEYNKIYTQMTGEIYGQIEYTFDNEYVKDVDTKELLFSPTPVYYTPFGAYVPAMIGSAPNTNIRILYDGGEQVCGPFDIVDFGTTGNYNVTTYPMLGHFNNALTPTFDINFGTNDFYFYQTESLTANNLYNLYWRRTVNQINVGKMLVAMFDLNEVDIQSLKLNDKIYIDNSWWNINKIADYNANINQLTKVELISIDTEIDLVSFQTGIGRPIGDTITAVGVDSILRTMSMNNNVIMPGADALVFGKGNVVTAGTKGVLIGDGQVLEEDGMVVSNLTVTGSINGAVVVNSAKYIANLLQSSTTDPSATVLENTIGDIVWTRISTGVYAGTLSGAFATATETSIMLNNTTDPGLCSAFWYNTNQIRIKTRDTSLDALADDLLTYTTIEIRTY
jgi:hypothetical protein